MGKKILDSRVLYLVLSVLLTVGLWCYVTGTTGTEEDQTYRNVPVVFDGLDILNDRDLMITSTNVTTNVTIRATPSVHARLSQGANNGDLTVTAKVSGISEAGSHSIAYTVNLPAGVSGSEVNFISTTTRGNVVTIDVARHLSRRIPLEGVFKGSVAEGYLAGSEDDFWFSPSEIVVSGRAEYVNQIHHALITISRENLTETVQEEYPFQLIGASGDELKDLNVTCDVDTVYTTFPIRAVAELPLKIVLNPGGGLGENDVSVELSTDSITVAGSKDAVAALVSEGAITLGRVDLAALQDGDERTFSVPLEDGLVNLSGVSEIKATFTFKKQVVSRVFAVTNIQTINEPQGWTVEIITKEVSVEVRGTQRLMDELIAENIRVVVDLQNINLAAGQQTMTASIALASSGTKSDIGEMAPAAGSNYTVTIRLAPVEENPPAEEG